MTTTASSSSSSSWPMQQEWKLISYSHDGGSDDLLTPALRSPAAKHYLTLLARHHVARPTDLLPSSLAPLQGADPIESLSVAVASLTAFIQLNWTGPELPSSSLQPGSLLRWADPSAFPPRSVDADEDDEPLDRSLNSAALESLTWQGEPAYHLCRHAFFLVFARSIVDGLLAANSALVTLPWWKMRITALHNRILDEPVSLPREVLAGVDSLLSRANLDPQLRARLLIERGLAISKTGNDKEANELFVQAAGATGLRYELSGALGKKTKFQKEEKTILVVLAESGEETLKADEELRKEGGTEQSSQQASSSSSQPEPPPMSTGWKPTPAAGQAADMPSNFELNDDTLLEQTDFTTAAPTPVEQSSFTATSSAPPSARDPSQQPPLAALDQTILLSLSLFLTNTSPEHGLVASQISAFVSRVLQHPRNWSVYTMALLLRSRLEASRTRTAERAVLQLQALVDQMPTTDSSARERLRFFFQLDLPSKWEMQAELARRYATLGVLRSALEIYERIEMWEDVVACLGSLGRQAEGIDVVRQLLEGGKVEASEVLASKKGGRAQQQQRDRLTRARKAKLWCLLGDLEPSEAKRHYLTAWRTSAGSSARAARSLGGLYFALTNYTRSALWLRRALRLSALMGRTWFMLGCCYLRREEWGRAARCFRRCTAVDEDDGEAWNNLASCYLRMAGGGEEVTQEELQGDEVDEGGEIEESEDESGEDDDDAASTTSSMATATTADSGMTLDGNRPPRAAQEDDPDHSAPRTILTPYILKILSQRCLRHSLKHAPDSWRVWSNYMVVCVDVGDMGEACRAFGQVVRLRAKAEGGRIRDAEGEVDWDVLRKLIDVAASEARDAGAEEKSAAAAAASTSPANGNAPAPSYLDLVSAPVAVPTTSATGNADGSTKARSTSFLLTSLLDLIHTTLPPLLPNPPPAQLPLLSARLYTSQRLYSQAITAYLDAFRSQVPPTAAPCAEREPWARACAAAGEMCENVAAVAGQLGDDEEEKRAKWKAKSLLRGFMAKHKSTWEGEEGWDELVRWREELEA